MDFSEQQKQVKEVFEKHADKWFSKAQNKSDDSINIIQQRNQFVEYIALKFLNKNSSILDVGCGTGDLVFSLLEKDFDAFGIDFAKSMIDKAKIEAEKHNYPPEKFTEISFFDFLPKTKLNMISANGFIEYISESELTEFINKTHNFLEKNGLLVFSSRNRLFNIFSFNNYTNAEIKANCLNHLIDECIMFNNNSSFDELLKNKFESKINKNLESHEVTGDIKVATRYQYTPFQLISQLQKIGFEIIDLKPLHIHLFTTGARKNLLEIHDTMSNLVQEQKNILQLIPQSSSFMLAARKQ